MHYLNPIEHQAGGQCEARTDYTPFAPYLIRLDPDLGYIIGNVQVVCQFLADLSGQGDTIEVEPVLDNHQIHAFLYRVRSNAMTYDDVQRIGCFCAQSRMNMPSVIRLLRKGALKYSEAN